MEAKQRGQVALAAIQPYISAAMGLPNRETPFQNGFYFIAGVSKQPLLFCLQMLEKVYRPCSDCFR